MKRVRNHSADQKDRHPTLLLPPGLQDLFFTFTMLWMCPVQKWNRFGRGVFFIKSEKTSGQTVRPKQ